MRLDEFIAQLEAAGWRSQLDAQHQRITELWRAEYPGAASYLDALEQTCTELAALRAERDALRAAVEEIEERTRPNGDMADLDVNLVARAALGER